MSKRHELLMLDIPHLSMHAFRPVMGRMVLCDGGGGDGGGGGGDSAPAGPDFSGGYTDSGTVGGNADVGGSPGGGSGGGGGMFSGGYTDSGTVGGNADVAGSPAGVGQGTTNTVGSSSTAPDNIDVGGGYNSGLGTVGAPDTGMFTGDMGGSGPSAIATAQASIANNSLTSQQAIAAANTLASATGMNPMDALMAVTSGYGTGNAGDLAGPMHSAGISYADIAVAKALGLGSQDVNSGQTVDQALAAANVHQSMPSIIGTIFGMAGSPVLGQLSKGLAQIGMGQNTLGGLIGSMGLKAAAQALGVPSVVLSALAQTDLGKGAMSDLAGFIDNAIAGGFVGGTGDSGTTGGYTDSGWDSVMNALNPSAATPKATPSVSAPTPTVSPQAQPEYTDWYLPSARSISGLENPFARSAKERGNIANYILGD